MIRSFVGTILLAASTVTGLVQSASAADDLRGLPMSFDMRSDGTLETCRTKCRSWVAAVGSITSETPRQFENFARTHDVRGAVIAFDSGGGSVLGTLELGRMIRRLDMTTTVGRTTTSPAEKGAEGNATLSPRADCESMCAFLLLAGTRRYIPAEARVLVHQIWLGDKRDDATAASYSAEDIMVIQRDIGRIVQFTSEMGGGADLVETALRIPPWERLKPLNPEELVRAKLQTADGLFEPAPEPPAASSASTVATMNTPVANDHGWSMMEKAGRPLLARRHTLTIEGEEIGTFELAFACSATANNYTATYTETRKRPGSKRTPVALKDVSLAVGRDSAVLRVVASESANKPPELISSARGVVSAGLMKSLSDWGGRSLTIETATTNNQETAIRVGNTGLAQVFPKFAAACAK
jgi:hypothetical protein